MTKKYSCSRNVILFLLLSLVVPLLGGCWDQVEIEDRALVLGLSIDTISAAEAEKEDKVTHGYADNLPAELISVTAQIAVPGRVPLGPGNGGSSGSGNVSPVWVVSVKGISLDDAMNNLQQQIADPRYLVHLRIIVVSEAVARGRLEELNDYLRRNPEIRRRTWLLVSEGRASAFMDVNPPLQRVPTLYILSMMEKAVASGKFPRDYIGTFWSADSKWGQSAYLPYVALRNKDNILIEGLACFSGGRMVSKTTPIEIGGFMAMQGMDPGGYSTLFRTGRLGIVMTKINERFTRTRSYIKNGKPHLSYQIFLEGDLDEHYGSDIPVNSSARLHEIEADFEEQIQSVLTGLVKQTQKERSDIFGMGERIRSHHPAYWKEHIHDKSDWENMYSSIAVDIKMTLHLRRIGLKDQ
ncbi:Ger(x)C family spore germination protein [Paenibacillus sp. MMS20-IR301]|uniref:Ger(x)C family spore germination protein n=1 Tax=Paenibacillus sp. MMS20-IR301 TaxID=2895946 RepID=UPI0028EB6926|nr:Ger(x)C family spore germination protein [Paenibacillus sp. MMS20-IR301]WNS40946.1 Ger(x)C family spore germination protein [Paenibacillus sp. MMS20-IR301]